MSAKQAKQTVQNTSAQIANANATFTVGSLPGPTVETSRSAPEASTQQQEPVATGEPGEQEDPDSGVTPLQVPLPPIYVALAISINLAADYQNDNGNVVKR